MQLIFLYIDNLNRNISDIGINFGNGFCTEYNKQQNILSIKKANTTQINYGENIQSIDLIAGKNGTGKTSILDLLALPKEYRSFIFNKTIETYSWFCIYHIQENIFTIEGSGCILQKLLKNTNPKITYCLNDNKIKSFAFVHNVNQKLTFDNIDFLYDSEKCNKRKSLTCMYYSYYKSLESISWYPNCRPITENYIGDVFYRRLYIENPTLQMLFNYLSKSGDGYTYLNDEFTSPLPYTIKLDLQRPYEITLNNPDYETKNKQVSSLIYNNSKINLLSDGKSLNLMNIKEFINKESFIILYLEYMLFENITKNNIAYNNESYDYKSRKDHLLRLLKTSISSQLFNLTNQTLDILDKIPNDYYTSRNTIEINKNNSSEKWANELVKQIDTINSFRKNSENLCYIRYTVNNISSGESYLINLYASLYNLIPKLEENDSWTCILCFDEPDARMHPEWSRRFLYLLTQRLQTDLFKHYNFQIIITTHSPFLIADVEPHHINCLQLKNKKITIKKAKNGFLSQLNDILMDDFFVDSVFGAFSENYVNNILRDIEQLENQSPDDNNQDSSNNLLVSIKTRIKPIIDPFIKKCINSRLQNIKQKREILHDKNIH